MVVSRWLAMPIPIRSFRSMFRSRSARRATFALVRKISTRIVLAQPGLGG